MNNQSGQTNKPIEFSKLKSEEVLIKLNSSLSGLSENEAHKCLQTYGLNQFQTKKKMGLLTHFFKNFLDPLVLILLVVSIISLVLGEGINALIVFVMVLMSVSLNFLQEYRASQAADKLMEKMALMAVVIRGGKEEEIRSEKLCPGDIILLNAGDLIPADAYLLETKDFHVNQSALTGESFPVEKRSLAVEKSNPDLTDLHDIVFLGTSVVTGTAKAIIFATGNQTEFGQIAKDINEEKSENDFTKGIHSFSNFIFKIVIFFVLIIFLINALMHQNTLEALMFAVAVAVGLTPEFLPMIMAVTMSKGALNMSKKGVVVKKLSAIPTFGSMDILCTDKTGTLTVDKIELVKYIDMFGKDDPEVLLYAYLNSKFQTGISNPMDEAVKAFKKLDIKDYHKVDEIPFDFERKRMSVVVSKHNQKIMICKGAPEEILQVSQNYQKDKKQFLFNQESKNIFLKQYHQLSSQGYRVLALAVKDLNLDQKKFNPPPRNFPDFIKNQKNTEGNLASEDFSSDEVFLRTEARPFGCGSFNKNEENNLIVLGFIAFLDPVKSGVKQSIDLLEARGIEIKVITGDNELVAGKICQDAGVIVKGVLLGSQLNQLTDDALMRRAEKTTIFARFSPSQKNRIIRALKSAGHVVGYMGDGINDAPSLKTADVGISVSNAVDVAKESADMILTHKSLEQLVDGVIEGRKIFANNMKYIIMGLSSNFGNMFSLLGAVIFLPFLPMLPIQILLNNFLYDFSQITIPSDNVDEEDLQKPKKWNIKSIRRFMMTMGPVSSLFDYLTFFFLYYLFKDNPSAFQTGWFMESLATQVLVIHIIRTRKIPFIQSMASRYICITTVAIIILAWLIPYTVIGDFFQMSRLPIWVMMIIGLIALMYMVVAELMKRVYYKYWA